MRVLVADILRPGPSAPQRGSFVRDQVAALRRAGVEVEHASFPAGKRHYVHAVRGLRKLVREGPYDVVHAHYGLVGWFALLAGARPLVVTFHGTDVRHPVVGWMSRRLVGRLDLVGAASEALFEPEGGRPGLPRPPGRSAVLPVGVDLERFEPRSRREARQRLGLDSGGRYLLFPADPGRPVKRHDRAAEVAARCGAELLVAGDVEPEAMPDWVNAAGAVLVTSDNEGFGLAVLEALACDVPVLSTPVGIAPALLEGVEGCLCAPFDAAAWAELAGKHLAHQDPRVEGRTRAEDYSTDRMAERLVVAYRETLD
jgi:glycosyltransferase involved in cell wall biosynthesis